MTNEELFKTLKDFEIAFLVRYRLSEFLPLTRQSLLQEAEQRGLTETILERLIKKQLQVPFNPTDKTKQCPRCKSANLHSWTELQTSSSQLQGVLGEYEEYEVHNKVCFICGYKIERSQLMRLLKAIFK